MALTIEQDGSQFRVLSQAFCTDWLADTASNRKSMVVFLRLLTDEHGKPLHTYQELAALVDSENRQASSGHMEDFRASGQDMLEFLRRRRKVDAAVVSCVLSELLVEPLAGVSELCAKVNLRLGRTDLTRANIDAALEQISCEPLRRVLRQQLSSGKAHYQESYLLQEMMRTVQADAGESAGLTVPESEGMQLSDSSAIRALVTPNAALSAIGTPLQWVCFVMALYFHGVPLSVLGQWFHVHKTTVLRWIMGLSLELAPTVFGWIRQQSLPSRNRG